MSKREFNIWNCVSTDKTKYFMTGVYYENGFKVATDGRLLAVIRADYPDEYENTIRDRRGNEINGQFPKYKRVIPEIEDMVNVSRPALCDMKIAYSVPTEYGVKLERFIFSTKQWKSIYNFIDLWANCCIEVYIAKNKPESKPVVFKAGENMLVIMQWHSANIYVQPGGVVATPAEPKAEPKTYICDGNSNHVALKVTYKQLKEVCPNVLTIGKSDMLENLSPMCTTWGQNGWNCLAYDFPGVIITSGDGANGVHIPGDLIKSYEAKVNKLRDENGAIVVDDYKALMDKFIVDVETWYINKTKKSA